jgi:hypothetical protein
MCYIGSYIKFESYVFSCSVATMKVRLISSSLQASL